MTLNAYQSLYFQLEDENGNVLLTKTGKFGPTNSLASTNFYVEFDDAVGGTINFTPRLKGIGIASSYEIFLNVVANDDSDLSSLFIQETSFGTNVYLDEDTHYFKLTNNVTFTLLKNFFKSKNITLEFLIYTRTSKTLVLTKTYDFELTSSTTTWTGGTVSEGNKDVENNYYNKTDMDINKEIEGSNSSSNINISVGGTNSDINIDNIKDFNFSDILKLCSHGFETFKILFSMLPNFVWGLVTTFIVICIILRLIGK